MSARPRAPIALRLTDKLRYKSMSRDIEKLIASQAMKIASDFQQASQAMKLATDFQSQQASQAMKLATDVQRQQASQAIKIASDFQQAASRIAEIQVNNVQEQYIRLAEKLLNIADSPLFKVLDTASTAYNQAISYISSQTFGIVDSIQKNERLWVDVLNSPLARALQETQRSHERLIESMSLPALMAVSDQIARYIDTNLAGATFPKSFAGQVLEALNGIYESSDAESGERNASIVEGLCEENQKKHSPSLISRQGLIQILIALIICTIQMQEGAKFEERERDLILRVQATIEALEKKKSEAAPLRKLEIYFIVQRRARLLSQPKPKGAVIGRLYPNQMTSLINKKGKWIYVQYFDYIDGVPKNGWVLTKYLRRADAITGQRPSDFEVSAFSKKAAQIRDRDDSIVLPSDEHRFFLNALAEDRKPSKRSSAAAKQYRRGNRKGVRYHVDN